MISVSVADPFTAALVFLDEFNNETDPPELVGIPTWAANTDVVLTVSSDGMSVSVQANAPVVPITVLSVSYDTGSGAQVADTDDIEWVPLSTPVNAKIKLTMPVH